MFISENEISLLLKQESGVEKSMHQQYDLWSNKPRYLEQFLAHAQAYSHAKYSFWNGGH